MAVAACADNDLQNASPGDLAAMRLAIDLARQAMDLGEVPVGAVVTQGGRVIAQAFNLRETLADPTAHAERVALTLAGRALGTWRLDQCTLYVTLEPCPMCAGAIVQARIPRVVYGAADPKAGACHTLYQITTDPRLNHRAQVEAGLLAEECGALLSTFFQARRPRREVAAQERF
jgi:tRNA(adenine34) deaminase